ncbi:MAG TPA: hypothetical protein VK279_04600 [Solirubrobacteraceae bacterium]|nr:hypothetical protein [Solirubrobacteraceae bacterium]
MTSSPRGARFTAAHERGMLAAERVMGVVRLWRRRAEGGETGGRAALGEHSLTKSELYERARILQIPGRSRMSKLELARAVRGGDAGRRTPGRGRS